MELALNPECRALNQMKLHRPHPYLPMIWNDMNLGFGFPGFGEKCLEIVRLPSDQEFLVFLEGSLNAAA